jgi:hypothetical protein
MRSIHERITSLLLVAAIIGCNYEEADIKPHTQRSHDNVVSAGASGENHAEVSATTTLTNKGVLPIDALYNSCRELCERHDVTPIFAERTVEIMSNLFPGEGFTTVSQVTLERYNAALGVFLENFGHSWTNQQDVEGLAYYLVYTTAEALKFDNAPSSDSLQIADDYCRLAEEVGKINRAGMLKALPEDEAEFWTEHIDEQLAHYHEETCRRIALYQQDFFLRPVFSAAPPAEVRQAILERFETYDNYPSFTDPMALMKTHEEYYRPKAYTFGRNLVGRFLSISYFKYMIPQVMDSSYWGPMDYTAGGMAIKYNSDDATWPAHFLITPR